MLSSSSTPDSAFDSVIGISFTLQNWIFLNIALHLDFIEKYDKYQLARARYISKKSRKKNNKIPITESNAESGVDDDDSKQITL